MSFDVAAQILQHRFAAIAREGAEIFRRIARASVVINDARYAAAVFDAAGRLIAQTQGEPSHSIASGRALRALIDYFAFDLSADDTLLVADPFFGGTEGEVITVVQPVSFVGDVRFFTVVRFALADFGGEIPGTLQPRAGEIWQESLRLTPVKIRRAGRLQSDVWRYFRANSRTPDQFDSDLGAALSVTAHMASSLSVLVAGAGLPVAEAAARAGQGYAYARARRHLAALAAGQGEATIATPHGDIVVRAEVSKGADGRLAVDLGGSSSQSPGPANLTASGSGAVVLAVLFGDLLDDIGLNEGVIEAIEIISRPGTVVDAAPPAAVSLGWRLVAPLVARAVANAVGRPDPVAAAGPTAVLFEAIGTRSRNLPILLSPGFRPGAGLAAAELLSGDRRLVSAEEAETAGTFRLLAREGTEDGGMHVRAQILRDGLEAVLVHSEGAAVATGATAMARSVEGVLTLSAGATIDFVYPPREGLAS